MSKLKNMRLIEIPKFRAVSSGVKSLNEIFGEKSDFLSWVKNHGEMLKTHIYEPQDFVWHENRDVNQSVWILAVNDGITEKDTAPYEIIEFQGGMFLVATADENDNDDIEETVNVMFKWINKCDVFEIGDYPKGGMSNMPNPDGVIDKALNIAQQQIYLPLKFRAKQ